MTKKVKMLSFAIVAMAMMGCNKPAGELVGVPTSKFAEANPYGMILVQGGSFMMGANTQSAIFEEPDNLVMASVEPFWIDQTEITNSEYHQFVNWVRDSIARTLLVNAGMTDYAVVAKNSDFDEENFQLNWKKKLPWGKKDEEVKEALASMFNSDGKLNTNKLYYAYSWMEYDQAIAANNRYQAAAGGYRANAVARVDTAWIDEDGHIQERTIERPIREPKDFISNRIIAVYPDTLVWARDFQHAFNDPLIRKYFSHPGYAEYPVVGVSWDQAVAFCAWRTAFYNSHSTEEVQDYRLPTEAEWEFAARGGKKMTTYPWGNSYARSAEGCFFANFKPYRGSYGDDGGKTTLPVGSFRPNDFGLYDMAGNVSEWTASTYQTTNNSTTHDMNPNLVHYAHKDDPDYLKRKVVKGGSWKDISYFMQCGVRTFEYQDMARSYIGFRCVRSHIGSKR